jgi:hypothetical protein
MTVQEQLIQLARDLVSGVDVHILKPRARQVIDDHEAARATHMEKDRARDLYDSDEINVDDDAIASRPVGEEGGFWVQGWLWCSDEEA